MSGNESLNEKQQKLVTENHNLIYGYAHQKNLLIDDYYDILAIGLCNAAKAYDENKGKFSTIAYRCMENELRSHRNSEHKKSSIPHELIISYNAPTSYDYVNNRDIFLENFLDLKSYNDMMYATMFPEIENMLTNRENVVIKLLQDGFSHSEIAEKLGCHRSNITYFVGRIRDKVNRYLYNN